MHNVFQRKEEMNITDVKEYEETMMEKDSWPPSPGGAFSASLDVDSNRKTLCPMSDEDRTSDQCMKSSNMDSIGSELCADDPILDDQATAVDNNLFRYQLNNASHTENDLGFLGDNLQDKESNDLLYYGWPEIETFEDVDRMFRSCDSTFGLEINNDDEFGWLSSPHEIEEPDGLKSGFNFSGCYPNAVNDVNQCQEIHGTNNTGMLNNENDLKLTPVSLKRGSQKSTSDGSPGMSGPGSVAHIDNDSQTNLPVNQSKQLKIFEGKRKERFVEKGDSIHLENLEQAEESNHSLNFQCSFSGETCEQKSTNEPCIQSQIPKSKNSEPFNHVLASSRSSMIESEDSGLPSVSLRNSSYGSSQVQSVESSHEKLQNHATPGNKKKERLNRRKPSGYLEKNKLMARRADSDPGSFQRQGNFESEVEGQSEVSGGDLGVQGEMDSSNIQELSGMSSVLDEVSIEASSFRQLQQVMEQLDIKTKLCIRDSLYRLARSAEQRHKCGSQTSGGRDDQDTSGALLSDETNKCTGFMYMETDTNPIDRSIAHLLFHRPPDPSATAARDAVTPKSYTLAPPLNVPPVMTDKLVSQEETTSANNNEANTQC